MFNKMAAFIKCHTISATEKYMMQQAFGLEVALFSAFIYLGWYVQSESDSLGLQNQTATWPTLDHTWNATVSLASRNISVESLKDGSAFESWDSERLDALAVGIVSFFAVSYISLPIFTRIWAILLEKVKIFILKDRILTQSKLNRLFEGRQFDLAFEYGRLFLPSVAITVALGGVVPVLSLALLLSLTVQYWRSKIDILRFCRRPTQYDETFVLQFFLWMKFAILARCVIDSLSFAAVSHDLFDQMLVGRTWGFWERCVVFALFFALPFLFAPVVRRLGSLFRVIEEEFKEGNPSFLEALENQEISGLDNYNIKKNPRYRDAFQSEIVEIDDSDLSDDDRGDFGDDDRTGGDNFSGVDSEGQGDEHGMSTTIHASGVGLLLRRQPSQQITIETILPGGNAASHKMLYPGSGIQVGDTLLEIEGRKPATLNNQQLLQCLSHEGKFVSIKTDNFAGMILSGTCQNATDHPLHLDPFMITKGSDFYTLPDESENYQSQTKDLMWYVRMGKCLSCSSSLNQSNQNHIKCPGFTNFRRRQGGPIVDSDCKQCKQILWRQKVNTSEEPDAARTGNDVSCVRAVVWQDMIPAKRDDVYLANLPRKTQKNGDHSLNDTELIEHFITFLKSARLRVTKRQKIIFTREDEMRLRHCSVFIFFLHGDNVSQASIEEFEAAFAQSGVIKIYPVVLPTYKLQFPEWWPPCLSDMRNLLFFPTPTPKEGEWTEKTWKHLLVSILNSICTVSVRVCRRE